MEARVYATARTASKIPTELSELSNVTALRLDVSSDESVRATAKAVVDNMNGASTGLDVLINNAVLGCTMPLLDVDITHAQQRLHDTDVWGVLRTIQAFC